MELSDARDKSLSKVFLAFDPTLQSHANKEQKQLHAALLRRHDEAHKASDTNKFFHPGGVYSPADTAAGSLEECSDRGSYCLYPTTITLQQCAYLMR